MKLKLKKLAAAMLGVWVALCMPLICTAANLTPPPISAGGITLGKQAVRTSATTWDVTLTIDGGGTVQAQSPTDIVLLLDCSSSMERTEVISGQTRLSLAKEAALHFIDTLAASGINANIMPIIFSGCAAKLSDFTSLQNTDSLAALKAVIESGFYTATSSSGSPAYGNSGGTNISAALAAGNDALAASANSAKYIVLLSDGSPSVYGADEKSTWRTDDGYMSDEDIIANTRTDAKAVINGGNVAKLFAVGFNVSNMQHYASENAAFTVDETTLSDAFDTIGTSILQLVQNGVVTDKIGEYFSYVSGSAKFTPETVGTGCIQPYVSLSEDKRTLTWYTGAWLEAGKTATLTYTLILNDTLFEAADKELTLNEIATFNYCALKDDYSLTKQSLNFPVPSDKYLLASLNVFSSGLPNGTEGTQQTEQRIYASDETFDVTPPIASPSGYMLSCVKVNGNTLSPDEFATKYRYKLPCEAKETTVEYCYTPLTNTNWTYSVEYYVNGQLMPSWTYSGTVPQANPIVNNVDTRLLSLPNFYEYPILPLPHTLKENGEVLRVYYVAVQLPAARLSINHTYLLNGNTVEKSDSEVISPFTGEVRADSFYKLNQNEHEYTVVSTKLSQKDTDGSETQPALIQPTTVFTAENGFVYTLSIIYNRAEAIPENPPEETPQEKPKPIQDTSTIAVTPAQTQKTLPATSGSTALLKAIIGLMFIAASVALQLYSRRKKHI